MDAFRYVPIEAPAAAALLALVTALAVSLPAIRRGDARAAVQTAARVLVLGAALAVVGLTLTSSASPGGVNLVPGAGIRTALQNLNHALGLLNLLGNIVMFAPIGFLTPFASRLGFLRTTATCMAFSVALELTQLMTGRSLDVDDVLLNTLGGALGAAVGVPAARLVRRWCRDSARRPADPAAASSSPAGDV